MDKKYFIDIVSTQYSLDDLIIECKEKLELINCSTIGLLIFKGEDFFVKIATEEIGQKCLLKEQYLFDLYPTITLPIINKHPEIQVYESCTLFKDEDHVEEYLQGYIYDLFSSDTNYFRAIEEGSLFLAEQASYSSLCIQNKVVKFFNYHLDLELDEYLSAHFDDVEEDCGW